MTGEICTPLHSSEANRRTSGGKGASLAKVAAEGLPVPPGFIVTTSAYQQFVEINDLQERILAHLVGLSSEDLPSLERASASIRQLFKEGPVTGEISSAICRSYGRMPADHPPVAVRSSATAEDLPGMSFAGQQDTYLNIRGEAALIEAVRNCWASLWSDRAIGYRLRMGIDQSSVAMGVVVQEMVPADRSGIMFTANPTTSNREEMVISASYGLGEAVVSNTVTPDTFRINRKTRSVLEETIGPKRTMAIIADHGITHAAVPDAMQSVRSLEDEQVQELVEIGLKVEAVFDGDPQDIEWSFAGGNLYILQSRPITGLPEIPPVPDVWESPIKGSKWIRRQVTENMPDPLSPLFDDLYLGEGLEISMDAMQRFMGVPRAMDKLYHRPLFGTVNGYAYMRADFNFTPVMIPLVMAAMVAGVTHLLRGGGIRYWRDIGLKDYLARVAEWRDIDPTTKTNEQLIELIRDMAHADAVYWFAATLAFGTAKVTEGIFDRFLKTFLRGKNLSASMFLRGFTSKTLEAQTCLVEIAEKITAREQLQKLVVDTPASTLMDALAGHPAAESIFTGLQHYFDLYGHQTYTIDFAAPTLRDTPESVIGTVKALVDPPSNLQPVDQATLLARREHQIFETRRSIDPIRRLLFDRLLGMALRYGPYREESLFYVGYAWPKLRQCARELGDHLVSAQILSQPDDVYFLTRAELVEASRMIPAKGLQPLLARQAKYRRALLHSQKQAHPPGIVPENYKFKMGVVDLGNRESQVRIKSGGRVLNGFAVSPGRVIAPASVILSPADFNRMKPGSILVCATTTPAWTPLFTQAVGLVTDVGGVLAHGSIIAREFGLPAVMGTGNATQRIKDGQFITVDGTNGKVILGGEEKPE